MPSFRWCGGCQSAATAVVRAVQNPTPPHNECSCATQWRLCSLEDKSIVGGAILAWQCPRFPDGGSNLLGGGFPVVEHASRRLLSGMYARRVARLVCDRRTVASLPDGMCTAGSISICGRSGWIRLYGDPASRCDRDDGVFLLLTRSFAGGASAPGVLRYGFSVLLLRTACFCGECRDSARRPGCDPSWRQWLFFRSALPEGLLLHRGCAALVAGVAYI